ncbi:MAG: hypothetical protein ACXAE3_12395 [Candidatus Kariarchaeaceae archaeon]|jgi:hypothetical protein
MTKPKVLSTDEYLKIWETLGKGDGFVVLLNDIYQKVADPIQAVDYRDAIYFFHGVARYAQSKQQLDLFKSSPYRYLHNIMQIEGKIWSRGFELFFVGTNKRGNEHI